jgi:phosphatidylserine decarboxylase
MVKAIITNLLWTEGRSILAVTGFLFVVGILWWFPLALIALAFALFSFYFFRNPERTCPEAATDSSIIVSPADGRVVAVDYDPLNGFDGYPYRVAIFLSVTDVHVNRAPMAGTIEQISYHAGSFKPAFVPKSSELNERNDITLVGTYGRRMQIRQIAGMIARRIVCWSKQQDTVVQGELYGMIKFGSRVEILLPQNVALYISKGTRVYGGKTIMGRWLCNQP